MSDFGGLKTEIYNNVPPGPEPSYSVYPLNVVSLIHNYPNCLTHIIDTDGKLDVNGHTVPLISSNMKGTRNFRHGLVNVRYFRCILSIVTHFLTWEYRTVSLFNTMLRYPGSHSQREHRDRVLIFPQIAIIFTNQRTTSFLEHLLGNKNLPTIFIFRLGPVTAIKTCEIRGEFFCVQCTQARRIYGLPKLNMKFKCASLQTCGATMEEIRRNNTESLHSRLWIYSQRKHLTAFKENVVYCHPCAHTYGFSVGIDSELASFLTESNRLNPVQQYGYPEIEKIKHGELMSSPIDTILVGTTAALKFVTNAGVYLPRTSYEMYFSPFDFRVWMLFLSAICLSSLVMTLISVHAYHLESQEGRLHMILGFAAWSFLTTIGQYKHANVPIIPAKIRGFGGICIVVVAWFVTSTFLVNVYSAAFSSDATRTFRYRTNYSKFLDLPKMKTYTLIDHHLYEEFWFIYSYERLISGHDQIRAFCRFHSMTLPQCYIPGAAWHLLLKLYDLGAQLGPDQMVVDQERLDHDYQHKIEVLANVNTNLTFLLDNAEFVSQILEKETDPVVFLIYDHDFPKYWSFFLKIMESNPKIKLASNFEDKESFLVQTKGYSFSSGLDPVYQGLVVRKMKMLMTSGIYGLWEKWQLIKFTTGGLRHDQRDLESSNNVQSLSFDNSGTSWLFMAQVHGWLAGVCVFVAEILVKMVMCPYNFVLALLANWIRRYWNCY